MGESDLHDSHLHDLCTAQINAEISQDLELIAAGGFEAAPADEEKDYWAIDFVASAKVNRDCEHQNGTAPLLADARFGRSGFSYRGNGYLRFLTDHPAGPDIELTTRS